MKEQLQTFVIRTSPWPPFRWLYAVGYAVALGWLLLRLARVREIRTLDLRLPRRGHCFGSSDLDMRAETIPLSSREFFALADGLADVLLPGGTWRRIFDLYLFPQPEHELQTMIGAQSIVRDRRWLRLRGRGARPAVAPPRPPRGAINRAVFDYGAMCQELFEGALDSHRTRLLYSQVARIDAEHAGVAAATDVRYAAERARVRAAADGPARRGRVRPTGFDELATAHAVALDLATALGRTALAEGRETGLCDAQLTAPGAPPVTLAPAVDGCREALATLGRAAGGALRSIVLGGVPGSRYEYRLSLVARDDLTSAGHVALCRRVRDVFVSTNAGVPFRFFRMRYPLLLTETLWRASGGWFHALRPVEEHFFVERHGVVLWGDQLPVTLEPDDEAVRTSAALAVADLRNRVWGALRHRQRVHLADLLGGRVPTLWLALERGRIATSPAEAVESCAALGMPDVGALVGLHELLDRTAPEDLPAVDAPAWQPAIEAFSTWLDVLVEAAARALRRPDSPSDVPSRGTPG